MAICPGFVSSGMVPDRPIAKLVSRMFFSCNAAVYAPIHALLSNEMNGGEWFTNFKMVWTKYKLLNVCLNIMIYLKLKDVFIGMIAAPQVILFQNQSYGIHKSTPSAATQDIKNIKLFSEWCQNETKKYK